MALGVIVGQSKAKAFLREILQREMVSHAYLFVGPPHVGKHLMSLTFAKILNCSEGESDSCDHCPSCLKIEHGHHPDLKMIEPGESTIKIDQVREIQRHLSYKLFEGKKKVVIIDQAERMTREAANALLKTLEEPPDHSLLILISAVPSLLLPTVISRCQLIPFTFIEEKEIIESLIQKRSFSHEKAALLAAISGGRLGQALLLDLSQLLQEREEIFEMLSILPTQGIASAYDQAKRFLESRKSLGEFLDCLLLFCRDLALLSLADGEAFLINRDMEKELKRFRSRLPFSTIEQLFDLVCHTQQLLNTTANQQLILEVLLMNIQRLLSGNMRGDGTF